MGIETVGERHPRIDVGHRVEGRIGQNRPPDEEVEIGRNASDLIGA